MNNKAEYRGKVKTGFLNKVGKHFNIIQTRLSFQKQKNEIENLNNPLLNAVLKAIIAIKYNKYNEADEQVFKDIDLYRKGLLINSSEVSYEIFNSKTTRQVKEICRTAASPKVWGQFLYFVTKYSKSKKILEIGTNVGISGSYILNGLKQNSDEFKFITMEGVQQLCLLSKEQFAKIANKDNFEVISGLYQNTFPKLIKEEKKFDLLFIDGNHRKKPTLTYFEKLKKCITDKAILIFDDIYYNIEMTEAWEIIKEDDNVSFSINMYKLGIVIIDKSVSTRKKSFRIHLSYN